MHLYFVPLYLAILLQDGDRFRSFELFKAFLISNEAMELKIFDVILVTVGKVTQLYSIQALICARI